HPRFRTPYKSNMLFFLFTGLLAAFVPADVTGEMTSIGTLFAFILVCAGVWIMRVRSPELERGFRVPAAPLVAILGIITCGGPIRFRRATNSRLEVFPILPGSITRGLPQLARVLAAER